MTTTHAQKAAALKVFHDALKTQAKYADMVDYDNTVSRVKRARQDGAKYVALSPCTLACQSLDSDDFMAITDERYRPSVVPEGHKDVTAELVAEYRAKCDAALDAGYFVPRPTRAESRAMLGIPVYRRVGNAS
jgi:hypothetical protein